MCSTRYETINGIFSVLNNTDPNQKYMWAIKFNHNGKDVEINKREVPSYSMWNVRDGKLIFVTEDCDHQKFFKTPIHLRENDSDFEITCRYFVVINVDGSSYTLMKPNTLIEILYG
uniref:Uncharacterized protein n=1 Tax=viral metagenome TaxID=1070528 RepID=A0A6C0E7Z9_9ZZZZ